MTDNIIIINKRSIDLLLEKVKSLEEKVEHLERKVKYIVEDNYPNYYDE